MFTKSNYLFVAVGIVIIVSLVFTGYSESKWLEFSKNHCRLTNKTEGSYGVVGGQTMWIAGTSTYSCDDGVTYWR